MKSLTNTCEQVHFPVKLEASGLQRPKLRNIHRISQKFLVISYEYFVNSGTTLHFWETNLGGCFRLDKQSKKLFRLKTKSNTSTTRCMYVIVTIEDKKNYRGKRFQPVKNGDY